MSKSLEDAVRVVGSQVELARRLGIRQSTVWGWLRRNASAVPAEYCVAIETATEGAVTRYDLRPDVFGQPPIATSAPTTQVNRQQAA